MGDEPVQPARESPQPRRATMGEKPLLGLGKVLALVGGLSAAMLGVLGGALFTLGSLLQGRQTAVSIVTLGLSMVAVPAGLGLAVAWQAIRAFQGHSSRPFRPQQAWPLALLFLLAVAGGQIILSLDLVPAATFPFFHVLASILPPLFFLALAGRVLPGVTRWREVILQLGAGALIATPVAFLLETILVIALALMAMFSLALRPGGAELLEHLAQLLQTAPPVADPEAVLPLILSPVIIASVTAFAAGAVPLIEEAVKAIGVPLFAYRRPGRAQAVLWGLACGAGFALVEGLLNAAAGLQAWAQVVVVRLGATLLHCLTGALMGLTWYYVLRRRWWRALGLYASSIAVHSFWNALSIGVTFLSVDMSTPALGGLGLGLMAALASTALAVALGLAGLLYSVRRRSPLAASGAEPPTMTFPGGDRPEPAAATTLRGQGRLPPPASEPPHGHENRSAPGEGGGSS